MNILPPDKGPWVAEQWSDGRIVLMSGDFQHDVALVITGDFDNDKMDYAEQMAAWLNSKLTPSNAEVTGMPPGRTE